MSTSNTHQQSLVDVGSKTRPLMLERESYIPWASRFRIYLNRNREKIKWLNKTIDEGLYEFQIFTPSETEAPSIQFVAELREALMLVYIRFTQLMNDLERNDIIFPNVTINTKFLNCLQPECLKYVTQVRLAKILTEDSYDDLFDYLQQFEKLVNVSRAKKVKKSHDPLALVAYTGSSSRTTTPYYVTHPSSMVDYDDDYQGDAVQNNSGDSLTSIMIWLARAITQRFSNPINNRLRTSSNTINQAIVQGDRVKFKSKILGMMAETYDVHMFKRKSLRVIMFRIMLETYSELFELCLQELQQMVNATIVMRKDKVGVILIDEHNDFHFANASWMEDIEELIANLCLMVRTQPANFDSNEGPSYDSAFLSEVQTPSVASRILRSIF
ncbi:hypothetical protein Tco_0267849 [Tanacetum coccineum]